MKKSASILDYSYPFLDPAVWDHEQKLYSYHKDFILRLLSNMYENYQLKQPEAWITDIRIIGSLTTSKWLFTSDMDVHLIVNLPKFIEINMPGTDPKIAYEYLDSTRKEFDRAKILAPMTQHPIEYYFEVPEFVTTNTDMVGIYSLSQDAWLKEPVIFAADVDFEESKKQVMTEAESIAEALDGSFGRIDRQIDRITELERVIGAWGPEKQQLFYDKIEAKIKGIEAEILKDLELRQALIDARHAAQDPMADIEIKFKWLQRFGFFGILTNLKNLMKETDGQVTMEELPLIKKIVSESELKDVFLKEALKKETETDICVDLDNTIAKPAKYPKIGEPIDGAKEALKKLQDLGYNVIIYSCRGDEEGGVDLIKEYLDEHDLPYDSIFEGDKPFAKYYIDDHAIQFDNWDNVLKQVEKSEKKASLHITAGDWPEAAWISPDGQIYPASSHDTWVATNGKLLKEKYNFDISKLDQEDMWDVVRLLIRAGWSRLSMAAGGRGYMVEVADLRAVPQVVFDTLINSPVDQFIIEQADSYTNVQLSKEELMTGQSGVNKALQRKRMQGSKAFSKREIVAHNYDVLGDPSLRQGPPRAVFNFVQKGVPEFGLPDLDMFDVLGDHPRYGSTINRKEVEQLGIPITEDKVAKQAKTKKIKQGEYSCVMASIPHGIAQEIVEFGVREIPDEDLYTDEDGNLGRELQAHVTIMYGLLTDDAKSVRRSFNHTKPFKAKLGKVRHFQPPERDFDVVTVEVVSDDLTAANKMIEDKFDCADDLPSSGEYKPHVTIAYVKRNAAKKHIGSDEFDGIEIELDTLVFSPRVGNKTHFSIGSNKKQASWDAPGYWIDPKGNIFDNHGEGLIHNEWVLANLKMLQKNYGLKIPKELYQYAKEYFDYTAEGGENADMPASDEVWNQMLQTGWVRIGDADEGVGVELKSLRAIPAFLDSILAEDLYEGALITVEDINHNAVTVEFPFTSLQKAVNQALRGQSKQASVEHVQIPEGERIPVLVNPSADELLALENRVEAHSLRGLVDPHTGDLYAWEAYKSIHNPMIFALGLDMDYNKYNGIASKHILHFSGNSVLRMLDFQNEVKQELNTVNASVKTADFLPSLVNAPDNKWQFADGGDDKEIPVDPDAVSDETTWYAPCTEGKPRTKEVWRQFISMFSNLFSKNDTQKIEAYDKELEEIEKNELGEDQTAHEYSKDFKDLNGPGKPHNTMWFQTYQDQEPSKPLPVTYSPQTNEDNLDQNSPGGYPRRFMGKPKGEWFSNEGEVNDTLIQMLRNRTAMIEAMTKDITKEAYLEHAYWIDPNGKVFEVRGDASAENIDYSHFEWIKDNWEMLEADYGIDIETLDSMDMVGDLVSRGWTRIGDSTGSDNWQVQIADIHAIPKSVDNVLAQFAPEGAQIDFADSNENFVTVEWPWKNAQAAVNRALRQSLPMAASLKEASITKQYALYVNNVAYPAIRTLTRGKAIRVLKTRFPEAYAKGLYEIREEEFKTASLKEAGSQSASVPDYLLDEWKTDQIMNDTDEEPYVNHDQRDYPYGMHDSPENTDSGIGWPKDNQPSVVHLDTLENPAFRLDPFGIGEYHITYYNAMPMSDGNEATNPE